MMAVLEPASWILIILVSVSIAGINMRILYKEIKQRRSGNCIWASWQLKIFSLSTISCGALIPLLFTTYLLPGTCYFSWNIWFMTLLFQWVFMGYYQLSRLHYCFARSQIYSSKGYPLFLYVFMYAIGVIIVILIIITAYSDPNTVYIKSCGINNNLQFYRISDHDSNNSFWIFYPIVILLYLLWDFITLALYSYKIIAFKKFLKHDIHVLNDKQKSDVYNRILMILYRVITMTLFYELLSFYITIIQMIQERLLNLSRDSLWILSTFNVLLPSIIYEYAQYLMLSHNTREYIQFLKCLQKTRIYYCSPGCGYCCRIMIHSQLTTIQPWEDQRDDEVIHSNCSMMDADLTVNTTTFNVDRIPDPERSEQTRTVTDDPSNESMDYNQD